MYKLIFEKQALRYLDKLEPQIKQRIWDKLQVCKLEPFRYLEPLKEIKGFKLRVGDYRIIIDIDTDNKIKILNVLKIGHRKNIY